MFLILALCCNYPPMRTPIGFKIQYPSDCTVKQFGYIVKMCDGIIIGNINLQTGQNMGSVDEATKALTAGYNPNFLVTPITIHQG